MASISKQYALPFDYVLYEMSMANVQLYNAVIPVYYSEEEKKHAVVNMDDAANDYLLKSLIENSD